MMGAPAAFGGGTFIADKSIWARADRDPVREEWERALRNGQIATCSITVLELLYSARNRAEFDELEAELATLENIPVTEDTLRIVTAAMRELADRSAGYHRIPIPDYIVAACAEGAGIGVLHYDHDFDRLQEVLNFESRWAADPGTLDYEGVTRG
jgi:predicted nucleic acid-binding protein